MTNERTTLTFLVETSKPQWSAFATSFFSQAIGVVLLIMVGIVYPDQILPRRLSAYTVTPLVAVPEPERPAVQPTKHLIPPPVTMQAPKLVLNLLDRTPVVRAKTPEVAPKIEAPKMELASLVSAPVVTKPSQIVHTGDFGGSQATPTTNLPAHAVQTGGFGDPNGFSGKGAARANVARTGAFDLPSGPGYGNGTGGANGARGTVASVGFGNGIAAGNSRVGSSKAVQQGGFGDVRQSEARVVRTAAVSESPLTAVQILSKPAPAYTEEARQLKLEGEVLLEVEFPAVGECRVIRVVRGMGHGLDEAAIRAAQQIRFRPATRDGQPADSTAVIHVLFQMAY
jgi:TonB family protein